MASRLSKLSVNGERLWQTLMDTVLFGGTPKGGIRRLSLSDEDRQVRDWLTKQAGQAEYTLGVDDLGNMYVQRRGYDQARNPINARGLRRRRQYSLAQRTRPFGSLRP